MPNAKTISPFVTKIFHAPFQEGAVDLLPLHHPGKDRKQIWDAVAV
jgi:hypothetical protein